MLLVYAQLFSTFVLALAYAAVAFFFFYFAWRRRDLALSWFLVLSGFLLFSAAITRGIDIFTLTSLPNYSRTVTLARVIGEIATAAFAVLSGVSFWFFVPQMLALPSRKQFKDMLESENGLRTLAEYLPSFVIAKDISERTYFINKQCAAYYGIPPERLIDEWNKTRGEKFMHPEDVAVFRDAWDTASREKKPFVIEIRLRHASGAFRWFTLRTHPFINMRGELERWFTTATDIHEAKLQSTEIAQKNRELEYERDRATAANKAKSQFLANMSHEIRTPLAAIMGFSDLLLEVKDEEERQRFVVTIQRNGRALLQLIDDLLDLAKIEAGKLTFEYINTNMPDFLRDVTAPFARLLAAKGIEFTATFASPIPKWCRTDPTRVRQIIFNLLGNAAKFTEKGHVGVEFAFVKPRSFVVTVTDSGVGISRENVSRIFDTFTQADSSVTRKYGGTGLGLSLSRRLAQGMKGDVRLVRSEPGVGSIFDATVCMEPLTDNTFATIEGQPQAPVDHVQLKDQLKGMKFLLAEDAEDNRLLVRRVIETAGGQIDVVDNGKDAIVRALRNRYDVVLMDIQMPKLDGLAATSALRSEGYKGNIVAISAFALPDEVQKALAAGCDNHISKPIDLKRMLTMMTDMRTH